MQGLGMFVGLLKRVSIHSLGWSQSCNSALAWQVLGLQACSTMPPPSKSSSAPSLLSARAPLASSVALKGRCQEMDRERLAWGQGQEGQAFSEQEVKTTFR